MYHFQRMIQSAASVPHIRSPLLAGTSPVAQSIQQLAALAADSMDATLLKGPAGAGKCVLAQAIHAASPLHKDCLMETSGADFDVQLLTSRWQGTLYLRQIMLLSVPLQHKLLLWLDSEQALHVRLIATSDAEDDRDRIIAPLRARLDRLRIPCPPLSYRREDIPAMLAALWDDNCDHVPPIIDHGGWALLQSFDWPEHYRSLSAFAAQAAQLYGGQAMTKEQIQHLLTGKTPPFVHQLPFDLKQHLAEEEKRYLVEALLQCNGVIAAAAARSGLKRTTFLAKMKRYGLARI